MEENSLKSKINSLMEQINNKLNDENSENINMQNNFLFKTQRILSSLTQINNASENLINKSISNDGNCEAINNNSRKIEARNDEKINKSKSEEFSLNNNLKPSLNNNLNNDIDRKTNFFSTLKIEEKFSDDFDNFDVTKSTKLQATNKLSHVDDFEQLWSQISINKEAISTIKSTKTSVNKNNQISKKEHNIINPSSISSSRINSKKISEGCFKQNNNENIDDFFTKKEDEIEFLRQTIRKNGLPRTNSFSKLNKNNDLNELPNCMKNMLNFSFSNNIVRNSSDKSFLKQKELANNKINTNIVNSNLNISNINLTNKIQHLYQNIINCEININADNPKPQPPPHNESTSNKFDKFNNLISPSNLKNKSEKAKEIEDTYGISKDLLKKIITTKNSSGKRQDNNRLTQKMEENKKLLDYFFTKRTYSRLNNSNDFKTENLFEKNSFNDFYSKISSNYSLKDLNSFKK